MERVPPSTPTKDDKFKELKEVQLKINSAEAELEVILRRNAESNTAHEANRQKMKKKEAEHELVLERIDGMVKSLKLVLKTVDSQLSDKNAEINNKEKYIESLDKLIGDKELKLEEVVSGIGENSGRLLSTLKDIEKQIDAKIEERDELARLNGLASAELEAKISDKEKIEKELADREEAVSAREINSENVRSDLRIWAVRLYNRYEEFIKDHEKKNLENLTEKL